MVLTHTQTSYDRELMIGAAHDNRIHSNSDTHPSYTVLRPYARAQKSSPLDFVRKVANAAEDQREKRRIEFQPVPSWDMHNKRKRGREGTATSGLRRLRECVDMAFGLFIKKFNLPLIPTHRRVCEILILSIVHLLMDEDELELHLPQIMRIFNTETIMRYIVIMMPRRMGKTALQVVVASCALYFIKSYHIIVFAQGQEITTMIGKDIRETLQLAVRGTAREKMFSSTASAQHVVIRNVFYDGSKNSDHFSRVTMLPGRVGDTHRGLTANHLIVDEADFAHKIIWGTYVTPLTSQVGRVLWMSSTKARAGNDSILERFAAARDPVTGHPPFRAIIIRAACDACIARHEQTTCRHCYRPPWIDTEQDYVAEVIAGKDGATELRNAADDGPQTVFHGVHVDFMCDLRNAVTIDVQMPFFITSIDPGGGESDTAIFSIVVYRRKIVLIGLDKVSSNDPLPTARLIRDHIHAVRNNRMCRAFRNATSIIVIEKNMAWCAASIVRNLSRLRVENIILYALEPGSSGGVGVQTNEANKFNMVSLAQSHLEDNEIVFMNYATCACCGLDAQDSEIRSTVSALRSMVKEQMLGFCSNITIDERGRLHYHFSGKASSAKNDDFVMALCIFLCVYARIMSNLEYLGGPDNPHNNSTLLQNIARMGVPT